MNLIFPKTVQCISIADSQIDAKGAVVIEAETGRVLLEKNKDKQLPMASTTKIMTALVAIENTDNLDEIFATDNRAVGIEGTSIYLKNDEHLSMRQLLLGLMLASGNDASLAIAYRVGGGNLDKFVEMMNNKAQQLNLHNTHFDNPHGLDSKTHYTSAYDLAIITSTAMKSKDFRDIVKTKVAQIPSAKAGENRFLRNKHKLLFYGLDGYEGVKTGFTDNALRCCVTSCHKQNMRLISVVLNCPDMFEVSKQMIEYCYKNYVYQNLLQANQYVDSIAVENGKVDSVKTYTKQAFYYPLKATELERINSKMVMPTKLQAPVKKDSEVGEYKIYLDKDLIFSTKIYTMEDVEQKDYTQKVKDIVENWYWDEDKQVFGKCGCRKQAKVWRIYYCRHGKSKWQSANKFSHWYFRWRCGYG